MSLEDGVLRSNVITTLGESHISWLNFKFGGLTVTTANYNTVATYIKGSKIGCKIDETKVNDATATYNAGDKKIYTRTSDIMYWDQKSTIVHECTHALMDILKVSTKVITDETCAYLAQGLYMFVGAKTNLFGEGIAKEAYKVVEAKKIDLNGQSTVNAPIEFTDKEVAALQKAIKADPRYKDWNSPSVYDGFP